MATYLYSKANSGVTDGAAGVQAAPWQAKCKNCPSPL